MVEILRLKDARGACYPNSIDLHTTSMPEEVDIRCNPTTVVSAYKVSGLVHS